MNEHSLNDPQLAALESQLAAISLQISPAGQQRYLYECGMAAGRKKSKTALRRWKVFASTLAVAVAAMLVPHLSGKQPAELLTSTLPNRSQVLESLAVRPNAAQFGTVRLDAWQRPESELAPPLDEIARLAQSDPNLRGRTVAALMTQVLQQ